MFFRPQKLTFNVSFYPFWFSCLISLILIVGKLLGEIPLSWLWVFSPMWITFSVTVFFILSFVVGWIYIKQE